MGSLVTANTSRFSLKSAPEFRQRAAAARESKEIYVELEELWKKCENNGQASSSPSDVSTRPVAPTPRLSIVTANFSSTEPKARFKTEIARSEPPVACLSMPGWGVRKRAKNHKQLVAMANVSNGLRQRQGPTVQYYQLHKGKCTFHQHKKTFGDIFGLRSHSIDRNEVRKERSNVA